MLGHLDQHHWLPIVDETEWMAMHFDWVAPVGVAVHAGTLL